MRYEPCAGVVVQDEPLPVEDGHDPAGGYAVVSLAASLTSTGIDGPIVVDR